MDPPPFPNRVKEEWSTSPPRPMGGLPDSWPPPFLTKTYEMVEDEGTDQMVSWSKMSNSFIVWDPHSFSMDVLPKHFKHKNFSSFVRQLNTYGFKKVDPDKWEFAHEGFLRGQKHLLRTIKRRKVPAHCTPHQQPCLEIAGHELDGDADNLRHDKSLLMEEVVKLRKDQQNSRAQIQAMSEKLQGIEQKQQHLMKFFTRAIHNPHFLHQLAELQSRRKELEEAIYNKINSIMPSGAENSEARHDGLSELEDRTLGVFELDDIEIEQCKEQQPDELNDELWQQFFEEMVSDEQGFAQK